jgi:tRNA threonylcarbamoyladenosine biosynthesis protein TsaE
MRLIATTPEETEALGGRLARSMPAGHAQMLQVWLRGELGSGKTTLVRGFLRALGHRGVVRSPTFTLVECYVAGAVTVVHADLYRLRDAEEMAALGLRDLAVAGHVWLVEWPERGGQWLPAADIDIALAAHRSSHSIELSAASAAGAQWLGRLEG